MPAQDTPFISGSSAASLRIIVADDSITDRLHLEHLLTKAGHQVIAATSGNEAKQLAAVHKPDLILLDILMDDGDGYQTCRHLQRDPELAHIPIIMVSSKANPVDIQWAKQLGARAYVVKPYDAQTLLDHLAAL